MPGPQNSDLAVRRYERYACDMPARVGVAAAHAEAVRPSRSIAGADGAVPARVVDFSRGGIGLHVGLFFPLTCALSVTVEAPGATLRAVLRVQRVAMSDRKPTYYIGVAFESLAPDVDQAVTAILAALKASGAPLVPEKSRA